MRQTLSLVISFLLALSTSFAQDLSKNEVKTIVSSQDSEGITEAEFDLAFLKTMENYILAATEDRANAHQAASGIGGPKIKLTSQANYVEVKNKKLIVIRVIEKSGVVLVNVAGIVDGQLKRVLCYKESPGLVPITSGPCGSKVAETFKVRF